MQTDCKHALQLKQDWATFGAAEWYIALLYCSCVQMLTGLADVNAGLNLGA